MKQRAQTFSFSCPFCLSAKNFYSLTKILLILMKILSILTTTLSISLWNFSSFSLESPFSIFSCASRDLFSSHWFAVVQSKQIVVVTNSFFFSSFIIHVQTNPQPNTHKSSKPADRRWVSDRNHFGRRTCSTDS